MASQWRILPSSSQGGGFPVMVKHSFGPDNYTVSVTDLCHIWSESLGSSQIVRRARNLESDIDPEEGQSQFDILLQKIKAALCGENDTEVDISPPDEGHVLVLSTRSTLPKPLKPLCWSLELSRLPDTAVRSQIAMPLISLAYIQKQQLEELSRYLNEKDNAIGKILDKLESLGLDLGNVFPNAATTRFSKKTNQREQIVTQVRGLSAFDRKKWDADSGSRSLSIPPFEELLRKALDGSDSLTVQSLIQSMDFGHAAGPVSGYDKEDVHDRKRRPSGGNTSQSESQPNGFQLQTTPRRLKQLSEIKQISETRSPARTKEEQPLSPQSEPDDSETTEDEGEAEVPSSEKIAPAQAPSRSWPTTEYNITTSFASQSPVGRSANPSPKKLGAIGRLRSKQHDVANEAHSVSSSAAGKDGAERSRGPSGSTEEQTDIKPEAKQPVGRRLGKIGGRQTKQTKQTKQEPSRREQHAEATQRISEQTATAVDSIPGIMEGSTSEHKELPTEQAARGSTEAANLHGELESPTPTAETARQKADRKRQELKRSLGDHTKTKTKKKRRF